MRSVVRFNAKTSSLIIGKSMQQFHSGPRI